MHEFCCLHEAHGDLVCCWCDVYVLEYETKEHGETLKNHEVDAARTKEQRDSMKLTIRDMYATQKKLIKQRDSLTALLGDVDSLKARAEDAARLEKEVEELRKDLAGERLLTECGESEIRRLLASAEDAFARGAASRDAEVLALVQRAEVAEAKVEGEVVLQRRLAAKSVELKALEERRRMLAAQVERAMAITGTPAGRAVLLAICGTDQRLEWYPLIAKPKEGEPCRFAGCDKHAVAVHEARLSATKVVRVVTCAPCVSLLDALTLTYAPAEVAP